jgi:MFS family permease
MSVSRATSGYPPLGKASYALGILMFAGVVSLLDRQILILLVGPIRHDLHITDTQVSLLQGLAFAMFYSFAGLPLGMLADRINRRVVIIVGILLWSAATIACGLSQNFTQLFVARVLIGFGEACLNPAAYSLLSDFFAPNRRGKAYGLFGGAAAVGAAASLFLGSAVLTMLHEVASVDVPVLGPLAPWKLVFVLAGLPGLLVALLMLTMSDPPRTETGPAHRHAAAKPAKATSFIAANFGVIGPLLLIYALWSMAGYGYTGWMATGYVRTFHLPIAQAGMIAGLIITIGSLAGGIAGGMIGDRWSRIGARGGKLRVGMWSAAIAVLGLFGWWLSDNLVVSIVCGCIVYAQGSAALTSAPAALNELVPNQLRGRMSALYLLVMGIAGICFGPTAVALCTDYLFHDDAMLRYSLILAPVPAIALSGLIAWMTLGRYSRAVAMRRAEFTDEAPSDGALAIAPGPIPDSV